MAIDDNASYELTGYQVKDLAQKIRAKADSNSLASVATSGLYSDLTGAPTIPTVYNGTLTIQQNGTQLGTFSANQSSNTTINITGGGGATTPIYLYYDGDVTPARLYLYKDPAHTTPATGQDLLDNITAGNNTVCIDHSGGGLSYLTISISTDWTDGDSRCFYIPGFGADGLETDGSGYLETRDDFNDVLSQNYLTIDKGYTLQQKLTAGTGINISAQNVISATSTGKPILYIGFKISDLGKLYLYKDESLTVPATGRDLLDGLEAGNNVVGYDDGGGLCYLTVSLGFESDGDYRLFRINGMYALPTWDYAGVSTDAYTITNDDFIGVENQNYLTAAEAYDNARHTEFLWSVQQGVTSLRLFSNQSSETSLASVISATDEGVATVFDAVDGGTYHLVCDGGTRFIGVKSGTNGDTMKFVVFEYRSASTPKWYKTEYTLQNGLTAGSNITISSNTISATDTTYSAFTGATSGAAGTSGLVPQPAAGDQDKYLKADGTWATVQAGGTMTTFYWNAPNSAMYKDSGLSTAATISDVETAASAGPVRIFSARFGFYEYLATDKINVDGYFSTVYVTSNGDMRSVVYTYASNTWGRTSVALQKALTAGSNIAIAGDGTISATDTTYSNFTGATSSVAGASGLVPAPTTSDPDKFLKGDGTWGAVATQPTIFYCNPDDIETAKTTATTLFYSNYDWNGNFSNPVTAAQVLDAFATNKVLVMVIDYSCCSEVFVVDGEDDNSSTEPVTSPDEPAFRLSGSVHSFRAYFAAPSSNQARVTEYTNRGDFFGATQNNPGIAGLVPAPAAGDEGKALHGDGTWKDTTAKLVEMSYGEANAWTKFINAYNAGSIVYCRASSNANPGTGSQTRKAFMAYVNNAATPTSVEFQYVRSVSSKTEAQPVDQVFVYTLTNTNGGTWSVASRNMGPKIAAGAGISVSYNNGTYTISLA